MLITPLKGDVRMQTNVGSVGVASPGTAVTTGGTAATKGTAVQLIASTEFDAYLVAIAASGYANAATLSEGCLDILVGAATEEVLIPNLLMGYCGGNTALANATGPKVWIFPLYIPAGTRIAAQAAGTRTATALNVGIWLYGGNGSPLYRVGTKVTTYGIGTVPNGTTITPGASGAEGAWTQVTAATSEDHFAFFPSFQSSGDTTINNRTYTLDLGLGAATEESFAEGYWYTATTAESIGGPTPVWPAFQDIPSGTRLTMRASCSGTLDSGYQVALHAVS